MGPIIWRMQGRFRAEGQGATKHSPARFCIPLLKSYEAPNRHEVLTLLRGRLCGSRVQLCQGKGVHRQRN